MAGPGLSRQTEIYLRGLLGHRPAVPTDPERRELAARRRMSRRAWAYVAGAAGRGDTMAANREALAGRQLRPRVLAGVADRDLGVELFGLRLPTPLLLAPIGALGLVHPQADLAFAAASAATGVPMIFSQQASVPMERCVPVLGDTPRFSQLYWGTSDDVTASLLQRAENAGAAAVMITLDTTLHGWRPQDQDLGHLPFARGEGIAQYTSDPVFTVAVGQLPPAPAPKPDPAEIPFAVAALLAQARRHPGSLLANLRSGTPRRAVQHFLGTFSRPDLSWADLPGLRRMTSLPIVLKGVLHPDDARRAIDEGVDGLVVSTHGGRQVDGGVGSLDALPDVVEAVADRVPVLFDSGIRTGADAVKALALGARAVLVGRPAVHGLAIAGAAGVTQVLRDLVAELDITIGLLGRRGVGDLDGGVLVD